MEPPRRPPCALSTDDSRASSSWSTVPPSALIDDRLLTNMALGSLSLQYPAQQQARPKPLVSILPRPMPSLADVLLPPSARPEHSASDANLVVLATLTTAIAARHPESQTLPRAPVRPFSSPAGSSTLSSLEVNLSAPSISPNAVPAIAPALSTLRPSSSVPAETAAAAAPIGAKVKKKRIRIKTDRRREQCRANQARYRSKQRDQAVVLEENVLDLRNEVRILENQRMALSRSREVRSSSNSKSMQAVLDFFRVFRHGLRREPDEFDPGARTLLQFSHQDFHKSSHQQSELLGSILAPGFRFGDYHGADAFMEQWRRYSTFHDDLVLELRDTLTIGHSAELADETDGHLICVAGKLTVTLTLTQATIQHVFPHLEPAHARIVKKLIGKRVAYNGTFEFEFGADDKVQRLDVWLDFVASLLGLLHNVRDVATVLEHARIEHNFFLCGSGTEKK